MKTSLFSILGIFLMRVGAAHLMATTTAATRASDSDAAISTESSAAAPAASRKNFAEPGQFPEVAAILVMDQFMCSGSVIADDAIVTAAVCFGLLPDLKPEEVSVVAGVVNRTQGVPIKAKRIIAHPLFRYYPRQTVLENDIAIIRLAEPLKIDGENISIIKLPSKSDVDADLTELEGVVAGWGAFTGRRNRNRRLMQYVNVTISNQTECEEFYKNITPAPYTLDHYQMCSEATEDLCIGESGAGLRVFLDEEDQQPTLVGIAEPTADCPQPKRPEIYTRVSEYLDWIKSSLED